MAGSYNHIVGPDGGLQLDLIENLGDAAEALEECYDLIAYLAGGNQETLSEACRALKIVDPWHEQRYSDDPMPGPVAVGKRLDEK